MSTDQNRVDSNFIYNFEYLSEGDKLKVVCELLAEIKLEKGNPIEEELSDG